MMNDDEVVPLLQSKHGSSSSPSTSSSQSNGENNTMKSSLFVKMMILFTILSGFLVFIARCDHMDMNGSMGMGMMGGHDKMDHTAIMGDHDKIDHTTSNVAMMLAVIVMLKLVLLVEFLE